MRIGCANLRSNREGPAQSDGRQAGHCDIKSLPSKLGPGDDFVWTRRQSEADAGLVIGLDCGGDVERGDLDIFRPMTALPIISAGINGAAYDGVFGHLLPMTVLKDQHCRREFRLSWLLTDSR
jgi:hypothetical protein